MGGVSLEDEGTEESKNLEGVGSKRVMYRKIDRERDEAMN